MVVVVLLLHEESKENMTVITTLILIVLTFIKSDLSFLLFKTRNVSSFCLFEANRRNYEVHKVRSMPNDVPFGNS